MKKIFAVLLVSTVVISFPDLATAQNRRDLIWEYQKMMQNDSSLGISLSGRISEHTTKEINETLQKAWIKKQIIIYLQMLGYLPNSVCYTQHPSNEALLGALDKFKQRNAGIRGENLGINSGTRNILKRKYLENPPEGSLPDLLVKKKLGYRDADILIQVFKKELILELYAKPCQKNVPYSLIKTYKIQNDRVADIEPKMREGDMKTPEGLYSLIFYQAFKWSDFYLAFRVSYPNRADMIRRRFWKTGGSPGGDINFHGCCVSIGCIPIGNQAIVEVFFFIRENQVQGRNIKYHIYPFRFDSKENSQLLEEYRKSKPKVLDFWMKLKEIYQYFTENHRIPQYHIDSQSGYYLIQ